MVKFTVIIAIYFSNVAFLDYKPFLFYHNSIFPKKRQEHAQKKGHNGASKNSSREEQKQKKMENNNNDDYDRIIYSV